MQTEPHVFSLYLTASTLNALTHSRAHHVDKHASITDFDVWKGDVLHRAEKQRAARICAVFDARVNSDHESCVEDQDENDWHDALDSATMIHERTQ